MSPSFQMHFFGIRVIETAFTQFAVEPDNLSFIIPYLKTKNILYFALGLTALKLLSFPYWNFFLIPLQHSHVRRAEHHSAGLQVLTEVTKGQTFHSLGPVVVQTQRTVRF